MANPPLSASIWFNNLQLIERLRGAMEAKRSICIAATAANAKQDIPTKHLSSEFDERKRGWKRCECPIVVSGTLQKRFKRHSTNLWEWAAARSIAEQFEAAGSWDGMVPVVAAPAQATKSAPKSRTTIEDAVKISLPSCNSPSLPERTRNTDCS